MGFERLYSSINQRLVLCSIDLASCSYSKLPYVLGIPSYRYPDDVQPSLDVYLRLSA